jgi:2-dehydro-3-deoxyglucarate aldolase/4-hydroxy-2-oxoheptanedioate aldolase
MTLHQPSFPELLRSNRPLIGTLLTVPSPEVAELISTLGFDWLFIDLEHSAMTAVHAQALLQAIGGRVPALIRAPRNEEVWIKKALDIGADGVIIPQVRTLDDVRNAVAWSKYPPQGSRSVGLARAHGYGPGFSEYLQTANRLTSVVIQAEHIDAVRIIDQIVRQPGVDAILCGPYDLSASMGKPGAVTDPQVAAALERVRQACEAAGLPCGVFAVAPEAAASRLQTGYRLIAVGTDLLFLADGSSRALSQVRQAFDPGGV